MDEKEEEILNTIELFSKKLPKFPDGKIDYSSSDTAPVITVFIKYKDKILLLKRSDKVLTYKGKWNTVAGYLDEIKPISEKIREELKEELGIKESDISFIFLGESYQFRDEDISKTWIIFPVLTELNKELKLKLDWEHTEYRWVNPDEMSSLDIVPHLNQSFKKLI